MVGLKLLKCYSTLAIVMAIAPIAGPGMLAGHLLVVVYLAFNLLVLSWYWAFNARCRISDS